MIRRSPLRRGRPLRRINPGRAAARRRRDFGPQAEWAVDQPCAVCGEPAPSEPSHVRSRGAGGRAADIVPMCHRCHTHWHLGRLEQQRTDLEALARARARTWEGLAPEARRRYELLAEVRSRLLAVSPRHAGEAVALLRELRGPAFEAGVELALGGCGEGG